MKYTALLILLPLLGCSTTSVRGRVSQKAWRASQLVFQSPLASHYGLRRPAQLSSLQMAIKVEIDRRRAVTAPTLEIDAWANRAALSICRGLPVSGPPPASLVDAALRARGIADPPPHLLVSNAPPEASIAELVNSFGQRIAQVLTQGPYRRVGIARCTPSRVGSPRIVVAFMRGLVRIAPLPRRVAVGAVVELKVRQLSAHRDLSLVISSPTGVVTRQVLRAAGGQLKGTLSFNRAGRFRVELTGVGRYGPEVLANFPLYVGIAPPVGVSVEAALARGKASASAMEYEFARLANAFRAKRGLPALRTHGRLAQAARAHSQEMAQSRFVGHRSPTTGNPADRIKRAGINALVVRENLARAYSPREALEQLAASPAHLANLVATDVTDMGVGIVLSRREGLTVMLLTQKLIKPARHFDPKHLPREGLTLVNRERKRAGLLPLRLHGTLVKLANGYLDRISDGQASADKWLRVQLPGEGRRYSRVGGVFLKMVSLELMKDAKELLKKGPREVGIAVRQQRDHLVVFVLLGIRR